MCVYFFFFNVELSFYYLFLVRSFALKGKIKTIEQKVMELHQLDAFHSNGKLEHLVSQYLESLPAGCSDLIIYVTMKDFEDAIARLKPSVSPAELKHYESLATMYDSQRS